MVKYFTFCSSLQLQKRRGVSEPEKLGCSAPPWGAHVKPGQLTYDGTLYAAVNGKDVLVDELHGPGSVGDLIVQVVRETSSFQLQLSGLQ